LAAQMIGLRVRQAKYIFSTPCLALHSVLLTLQGVFPLQFYLLGEPQLNNNRKNFALELR